MIKSCCCTSLPGNCSSIFWEHFSMRRSLVTVLAGLLIASGLMLALWLYSDRSIYQIQRQSDPVAVYERHYAMISSDTSSLWQSVYKGAVDQGKTDSDLVEWIGQNLPEQYDLEDCLRIAIASQVDGIILRGEDLDTLTELIADAYESGIPVVTMLEDVQRSERISFVGLSGYELGEFYGSQIADCLKEGENRVTVLMNMTTDADTSTQSLLYSRMLQVVDQQKKPGEEVIFETRQIDTATSFDAEEDIRDLFLRQDSLSDIVICLDLTTTECVCQALVDHNLVGTVNAIGFSASETVAEAIDKGVMKATFAIDGEALGRQCIRAMDEYISLGNVSNYFNVSSQVIDAANAKQYLQQLKEDDAEEVPETEHEEA